MSISLGTSICKRKPHFKKLKNVWKHAREKPKLVLTGKIYC